MANGQSTFPRGAEWRQWDLHIHTPASFEWKGKRFSQMSDSEKSLSIDKMIEALNTAEPAVFVLMDYWTFDGWFALKKRLSEAGAPTLLKKVFPGIELRLVSPTPFRLNAHVVFSDDVSNQDLNNFKSKLSVALINQPLSDECLIRLAREKIGDDLIEKIGLKPTDVAFDDGIALLAGSKTADITTATYQEAIQVVPNGKAIGFMPWDTNDGLAKTDWKKHYSYVIGLMNSSPIFETRRLDLSAAFTGVKTSENQEWFDAFQSALDNVPRLAVSGSDAHSFESYGKFPFGKATWIKADPTFLGLLQAIKEPAKRSFIGERPQKLIEVSENKTYFINSISVEKNPGSPVQGNWLDGCNLILNPDLVAIIGNKGSGKSALADVIALLGNCRSTVHFSFLAPQRFRSPPTVLAKHFTGKITWADGTPNPRGLADDPPAEAVELVRYIPQKFFEDLCNEHVSGKSNVFENELRSVIFAHTNVSIRQDALDFDQLIEQQESSFRDRLGEYRKDLAKRNQEIENIESQLHPDKKKTLEELLSLRQKQIDEHKKLLPPIASKPPLELNSVQKKASEEFESIGVELKGIEETIRQLTAKQIETVAKEKAVQSTRDRLKLLSRQYAQFSDDTTNDLVLLGLTVKDVISVAFHESKLEKMASALSEEKTRLNEEITNKNPHVQKLAAEQLLYKAKLDAPQQTYQQELKANELWQGKLKELVGAPNEPETLEGLKTRITQLNELPERLKKKQVDRLSLSSEIFKVLNAQRQAREELFKPVQELIQSDDLIRTEHKLKFLANLGGSANALAARLFELVKQNSGAFRGEEESYATVRKVVEQYDFNNEEDILKLISELHQTILTAVHGPSSTSVGIDAVLRVNRSSTEVYDLLFGLSFLEPRYTLSFQETQIEQLSPGQRGALLLIFYLLVDKGRNPIILDQPEENLDNETVVSLLVPVLNQAKKRRQIIMVTHNPNLAVVCDAEQVIYSTFDRKNGSKIQYVSGSIESPSINAHVVNVLEGTKPAFNNRRMKYH
ncbi:MAG: transporter [Herminiimonas sp.]|nr:transporter [Herminiimonas sp.]